MADLPRYYIVFATPVKLLETLDGGMLVLKFDWETGQFEYGMDYLDEILLGKDEVEQVSEDEFIQHVEALRAHRLEGSGRVYDLYKIVNDIEEKAKQEERALTVQEAARIVKLRKKSYKLFEELSNKR